MSDFKVYEGHISELTPDDHNANGGSARGRGMVESSVRAHGFGRPGLIDRNGKIIAGNTTTEVVADLGLEDAIIVETDGTRPIYHKRIDLDLDRDQAAIALAIEDNRASEVGLSWQAPELEYARDQGVDLSNYFWNDELAKIFDVPLDEPAPLPEPPVEQAAETRPEADEDEDAEPRTQAEHDMQAAFFKWAEGWVDDYPDLQYLFAVPNGGLRDKGTAVQLKKEGVKRGVPDIGCPLPRQGYSSLWIENKVGKNDLRPDQVRWVEKLQSENARVEVIYDYWQDIARIVMDYLGFQVELPVER